MRPHSVSVWVIPLASGWAVALDGSGVAVVTDAVAAAVAPEVGPGASLRGLHAATAIERATTRPRVLAIRRDMATSGRVRGRRHGRPGRQKRGRTPSPPVRRGPAA